jgi:hypothetical protein
MAMSTPANMSAKPMMPTMSSCRATPAIRRADSGNGEQHAEHDRPVVGSSTTDATHRMDEVRVIAVEVPLHLLEKTLLLL